MLDHSFFVRICTSSLLEAFVTISHLESVVVDQIRVCQ